MAWKALTEQEMTGIRKISRQGRMSNSDTRFTNKLLARFGAKAGEELNTWECKKCKTCFGEVFKPDMVTHHPEKCPACGEVPEPDDEVFEPGNVAVDPGEPVVLEPMLEICGGTGVRIVVKMTMRGLSHETVLGVDEVLSFGIEGYILSKAVVEAAGEHDEYIDGYYPINAEIGRCIKRHQDTFNKMICFDRLGMNKSDEEFAASLKGV